MSKLITILTISFLAFHSFGAEVETILKKMQTKLTEAKALEYSCTYDLFKGYNSSTVETSYTGYLYRSDKQVYQKIEQTEFVYGTDFFLKINHTEKAMLLDFAQKNINMQFDLEEILKNSSEKTIESINGYYNIVISYNNKSTSPFNVVKIHVDTSTYELSQLDLYYVATQDFSDDYRKKDLVQPRLRIKFKDMNTNPAERKDLFKYTNYISTKNSMLSTTGKCEGYYLIDNRLK